MSRRAADRLARAEGDPVTWARSRAELRPHLAVRALLAWQAYEDWTIEAETSAVDFARFVADLADEGVYLTGGQLLGLGLPDADQPPATVAADALQDVPRFEVEPVHPRPAGTTVGAAYADYLRWVVSTGRDVVLRLPEFLASLRRLGHHVSDDGRVVIGLGLRDDEGNAS